MGHSTRGGYEWKTIQNDTIKGVINHITPLHWRRESNPQSADWYQSASLPCCDHQPMFNDAKIKKIIQNYANCKKKIAEDYS